LSGPDANGNRLADRNRSLRNDQIGRAIVATL